jgi:hypothetical protein
VGRPDLRATVAGSQRSIYATLRAMCDVADEVMKEILGKQLGL